MDGCNMQTAFKTELTYDCSRASTGLSLMERAWRRHSERDLYSSTHLKLDRPRVDPLGPMNRVLPEPLATLLVELR